MIGKIKQGYLLLITSCLLSCSPSHNPANKSGISMETISVITFAIVGIAILAVYYTTKKK